MLPKTEFYKHPQMADGTLGKCKECCKRDVSANYRKRREQYAAYESKRFRDPKRKKLVIEYAKKRRQRYPHKDRARQRVHKAVKSGRLLREPCKFCGATRVQAHHHDYNKPLDVTWVCFKCHREKFHGQTVTFEEQQDED